MNRRRISRNRLEGFKNVKKQPIRHYKRKMKFREWLEGGLRYCESKGAYTYVYDEISRVFIEWPGHGITVRSFDDLEQEYFDEYCSQWK